MDLDQAIKREITWFQGHDKRSRETEKERE
jgi:hypothetical protein